MNKEQKNILLEKADEFSFLVYKLTKDFPKSEIFGITSQLRRATLSIPLNIIEGFARSSIKTHRRFLEIAYASLKETKYLLYFSCREKYISKKSYEEIINLSEEIGKILWTKIQTLKNLQNEQ